MTQHWFPLYQPVYRSCPLTKKKWSLSHIFLRIGGHLYTSHPNTYILESVLSHGQCYPTFEQPGPSQTVSITVVNPDLQTRERPGYPDPEISEGGQGQGQVNFLQPFWPHFGLKVKGGQAPCPEFSTVIMSFLKRKKICTFIGLLYKLSFLAEK